MHHVLGHPALFFAFLRALPFWKGIYKIPRWTRLEILVPKHPWKCKIGLLQLILATKRYDAFFWVTLYTLEGCVLLCPYFFCCKVSFEKHPSGQPLRIEILMALCLSRRSQNPAQRWWTSPKPLEKQGTNMRAMKISVRKGEKSSIWATTSKR